jgi:hypothetical protein
MELIKVQLARSIWLFDTQELNPRGLNLYPDIYQALIKQFHFSSFPKLEDLSSGQNLHFKQGRFLYELAHLDVDLEYYSDGLIANTRHSTEAADAFLAELISWIGSQLGVSYSSTLTRKRVYKNELVIELRSNLQDLCDKTIRFSERLANIAGRAAQPTGLIFGSEDHRVTFTIDRRDNTPFDANRFYSVSSMTTTQHLLALDAFEQETAT